MTTKREHPHPPSPHEPESCIQSLSTPAHHHHHSTTHSGSAAYGHQKMVVSKNNLFKKNEEGPLKTHLYSSTTIDLLLSIQYSYCLRNGAYGRHANSLHTSAIHFSPQPHKPIVLERQAWPPLSLVHPFSSSLFDSEEENSRRRSTRAVEGASAISPSLPVF